MADLPNAAIKRLISKSSDDLRIAASALQLATSAAEDYVSRLANAAAVHARAARRKTIMDADIISARKELGPHQDTGASFESSGP